MPWTDYDRLDLKGHFGKVWKKIKVFMLWNDFFLKIFVQQSITKKFVDQIIWNMLPGQPNGVYFPTKNKNNHSIAIRGDTATFVLVALAWSKSKMLGSAIKWNWWNWTIMQNFDPLGNLLKFMDKKYKQYKIQ